MVTLHESLVSSSARQLPIRKRPDLTARRQTYLGRSYWVVKEPIGLNYFRFQEEEYAILQMLDGQMSLDEIKDRFEADFPPQKITLDELQQFLGMLHRSGLVVVAAPGQGHELHERRRERRRKELIQALSNVLCIRFKGFDPERLLERLYPYVRWFYSPVAVTCCLLLGLAAVMLVLIQFDDFRAKLPAFHQFFNFYNAMWLSVVLGVTKVLHEFGHGMLCKHFGGECHEMGVMVLVLTPCLYCNVSDSWMLPSKWQRAAIGAGGMYVELVLASLATFGWWYTTPGLLNNLCLNVMFVCSVSTLVFNANPLLRYDGYYILADVTEIPNLRQKATTILSRKLGDWCMGLEQPEDPFLPERNQIFFALYSVASAVYRWVVVFSILWFLYKIWEPYRLEVFGEMIGIASLWGLIVMPLYQVGKFFYVPGRLDKVKKARMVGTVAIVVGLVLGVLLIPVPHNVMSTVEIQPRDAEPVYVDVATGGVLAQVHVKPGQQVAEKQPLARLQNIDLSLEIAKLDGERRQRNMQLQNLLRQGLDDPLSATQIPEIRKALGTLDKQLEEKQREQQRLELLAPAAGTVLPPPATTEKDDPEGQLAAWSGTPLDPENKGAYLKESVMLCQIGDPQKLEAILIIDQRDVEDVKRSLDAYLKSNKDERLAVKVDFKLDALPFDTLHSHITEIAQEELKISPQRLSTKTGGELATTTDPKSGAERPQSTSYQARAPLDDPQHLLRQGLRGRGKIHVAWLPLGTRLWRLLTHTFNFKL